VVGKFAAVVLDDRKIVRKTGISYNDEITGTRDGMSLFGNLVHKRRTIYSRRHALFYKPHSLHYFKSIPFKTMLN
jgi:hypothetical protein